MNFLRFYRYIRILSLDIVAGAMASLCFAANVMEVELHRSYYIILGITVWLIYTADHLMDGARTKGKSLSETHNFFYRFQIPLVLVFLILLILDFRLVVYRLDQRIVEFGMAPALATVFYLLLNRYYGQASRWFFIKELWISLIYTIAIWGGPVILAGDSMNTSQLLLASSFFLVISSNVLIYSIYERELDAREGTRSLVRDFGLTVSLNTSLLVLIISLLLSLIAYLFFDAGLIHWVLLTIIPATLLLIIRFPYFFSENNRYGIMADLVIVLFFLASTG